ncbi:hypothetical protein LSTR_LSTR005349 [Laodelphax striatellus]|uniref:Uncharacterized protein n=1 Tax=Laodelphax striatellus TaxID=195883 RepID=A0A482WVC5_LAOST|nr:hypothetical protein LSTR_LSTR005349 [Laodelphax striatellus]
MLSKYRMKSIPVLLRSINLSCRTLCSALQETSGKANYPPIEPVTEEYKKLAARKRLHEKYRKVKTVEEKLFALNLPRYWGWETTVINEGNIPYNFIDFVKYATRTHLVKSDKVPVTNPVSEEELNSLLDIVKPQIQRAILFQESLSYKDDASDIELGELKTKSLIEQVNRILMNNLGRHAPHIFNAEVDYDPRFEAFWKVGGFSQSIDEHARRTEVLERDDIPFEGHDEEDYANRPVEHWFQYFGRVLIQLRAQLPLRPISEQLETPSGGETEQLSAAKFKYSPAFYGLEEKRRFGTTLPGFWPGSESEYQLLSYHSCQHLQGRPPHFGRDEHEDALHSQAMLAGHASCHGHASYQGFSTFNEVTYPLVSQHVITDGRHSRSTSIS